ncbi:hypothetical protein FGO68_gene9037 [Halteria grandinella]|uniref:Metallo-beta-lactamase domain-containing protein n=1 Tax=Halteria grandinella TaxID=5974 RepID=A0A8J8NJN0_HALGN|nr:hypothetical protein FGO68_gene9037 [Halteria grandinella]
MIGVFVIPMLSDNFSYYVYTKGNIQQGFFVDVSEPEKLTAFTTALQITTVSHILTTHKHGDHSGGNQSLATQIGSTLKIVGGANDNIPACNHPVNDGDKLDDILPGVEITCLHTPCHTRGHILYYLDSQEESKSDFTITQEKGYQHIQNINRCVFTGDTVFLGGCGRFFEGTAEQMLSALDRFGALPDDTKVFCGHEYSVKNLEFGMMAEPSNPYIKEWHSKFAEMNENRVHTVPGTVATEKLINVFMRTRVESIQRELVKSDDPVKCMAFLREFKNTGALPGSAKI